MGLVDSCSRSSQPVRAGVDFHPGGPQPALVAVGGIAGLPVPIVVVVEVDLHLGGSQPVHVVVVKIADLLLRCPPSVHAVVVVETGCPYPDSSGEVSADIPPVVFE